MRNRKYILTQVGILYSWGGCRETNVEKPLADWELSLVLTAARCLLHAQSSWRQK